VRAVDRAVAILRCFTIEAPVLTVAQIQAASSLSRPTVYRLLETMERLGMIQSEGNPQRFQLAHGVMQLARVWLAGLNLPELAQPIVEEVRDLAGETAALFVPRAGQSICVIEYRSHEVLAMSRGIGSTADLTEGASGKAMLAFMSQAQQQEIVSRQTDAELRKRLEQDLARAVTRGYASSHSEVFAGAVALAAPVFDGVGVVAGSLAVYGPESRLPERQATKAARLVMKAAERLSRSMGCPPDLLRKVLEP